MDADLIGRAQRGDEEAFASLAVAVGPRLHRVAYKICATPAWPRTRRSRRCSRSGGLPRLRDLGRFDGWSYRLLVRACYAEGRRARRMPNLLLMSADEPHASGGEGMVVDRDQLERGFRRLSIDHRAVVVLHHYLDMPLDEVAETLGVPAGTARSRLHHAMRALRAALEADARPPKREAVS